MKFLVIDDLPSIRLIAKTVIAKSGEHTVLEAGDGKEAMAIVLSEYKKGAPIEFILCDWNMPLVSGLQFLQKIREVELFKDIPFVMITAESEIEKLKHQSIHATGYLSKPFTPEQIQTKIKEILDQQLDQAA
ncbi:MAG: response regulator [Halobacteriovorax sp.]|nr:response regulator [Halobacteriovorax sp.]|tara:strand:+ start:126 stop:521 length:396 start_codon:yes stop_codon:yes gene_type:complete